MKDATDSTGSTDSPGSAGSPGSTDRAAPPAARSGIPSSAAPADSQEVSPAESPAVALTESPAVALAVAPADARAATAGRPRTNPAAPSPAGARTAADVVTPEVVAQLTRGVAGSGRTANHTPFTGKKLADLPESTPEDVAEAYARARAAQPVWAATPVRTRAAVLLRFHDLLLERQAEVLDLIQLETGKARLHAHEEVQAVAVAARHYGRRAGAYLRPRRHTGVIPVLTKTTELRHPRGIVGQIAPWNYPLELSVGDALPAFVSGNAVVMKPDTETALTALWARDLLIEAGLPEAVFQIVLGEGPVVGPEVVRHADYVSFTGSTRTGREVARGAAARLVGVSLELGGKNAMLVLHDADLDEAAAGAVRACFSSAGQLCVSVERLYVHASVADRFVERFAERTKAMRLGGSLSYGADMGSLAGERQLETVTRHVDEAVAKGATLVAGGVARPDIGPLFYEPTILDGVEPPMAVCTEETFGPVVSVYRFTDEDEAVELANATPYGLNSSVWTRDGRRGHEIAARLRTGTVNINEGYASAYGSVRSPMGGMKDSGLGRRHGSEGILKYTEAQTVAQQRLMPLAPSFGMDDGAYAELMNRSLRVMKALRLR
ncbi:succinic semialdehyde dehydrogenase [Streptomyces sp. NPDC004609]|uniref:succinic semialdehyde dehydrogenase n=1 Tax=Streptomyces sp. NPDC004609 TaxID=3364704 RepID=UPI0036C21619